MKKIERKIVFSKYDGRCAYCGCELPERWHIDHIIPQNRIGYGAANSSETINHIDNLNPACPSCNINKHDQDIDQFRAMIEYFIDSLNTYSTQYKLAKRYGLVTETGNSVEFYFEQPKTI